jgi:Zn-dependent metalloprotease
MSNILYILFSILLICCGDTKVARAQAVPESKDLKQTLDSLKLIYPDVQVQMDTKSGLPSSITNLDSHDAGLLGQEIGPKKSPEEIVTDFFKGWGQGLLQMDKPAAEIRILGKKPDPNFVNKVLVRVQQVSANVDIVGAEAVAVVDVSSSTLDSLNLDFVPPPSGNLQPRVPLESVANTALQAYKKELSKSEQNNKLEMAIAGRDPQPSKPKLVFAKVPGAPDQKVSTRLCYLVSIGTYVFCVDAETGSLIAEHREVNQIEERHTYDSNSSAILPGLLVLSQETDVVPTAQIPQDARNVHAFASVVYNYYLKKFGRDGYDGGHAFESCVRFPITNNALWVPLIQKTIYAPGFAAALEIAGHEWTHAVIQHDSGLAVQDESGALNESLADFFGIMVRANQSGQLDWKIGDTLPGHSPSCPLRDLANPHGPGFLRNQPYGPKNSGEPDQYSEFVKDTDPICNGSDNGCVHMNSGIFSKALQLAVDGGDQLGVHVPKVGSAKMETIIYGSISRLPSGSSLLRGAQTALQVCQELQIKHVSSISEDDCTSLGDAFRSVGLQ